MGMLLVALLTPVLPFAPLIGGYIAYSLFFKKDNSKKPTEAQIKVENSDIQIEKRIEVERPEDNINQDTKLKDPEPSFNGDAANIISEDVEKSQIESIPSENTETVTEKTDKELHSKNDTRYFVFIFYSLIAFIICGALFSFFTYEESIFNFKESWFYWVLLLVALRLLFNYFVEKGNDDKIIYSKVWSRVNVYFKKSFELFNKIKPVSWLTSLRLSVSRALHIDRKKTSLPFLVTLFRDNVNFYVTVALTIVVIALLLVLLVNCVDKLSKERAIKEQQLALVRYNDSLDTELKKMRKYETEVKVKDDRYDLKISFSPLGNNEELKIQIEFRNRFWDAEDQKKFFVGPVDYKYLSDTLIASDINLLFHSSHFQDLNYLIRSSMVSYRGAYEITTTLPGGMRMPHFLGKDTYHIFDCEDVISVKDRKELFLSIDSITASEY